PAGTPHEIYQIAQAWSGSGATPFQKIMAIQEHLRSFTYNLNVPAPRSTNDLLYFLLKSHQGYCEQFAGSMAVLLRALGLPAQGAACAAGAQGVGKGRIQQRKGGPKETNPDIHDLRSGRTFGNGGFALPSPHRRDWSGPALAAALALFGLLAFGIPLGKA